MGDLPRYGLQLPLPGPLPSRSCFKRGCCIARVGLYAFDSCRLTHGTIGHNLDVPCSRCCAKCLPSRCGVILRGMGGPNVFGNIGEPCRGMRNGSVSPFALRGESLSLNAVGCKNWEMGRPLAWKVGSESPSSLQHRADWSRGKGEAFCLNTPDSSRSLN